MDDLTDHFEIKCKTCMSEDLKLDIAVDILPEDVIPEITLTCQDCGNVASYRDE